MKMLKMRTPKMECTVSTKKMDLLINIQWLTFSEFVSRINGT